MHARDRDDVADAFLDIRRERRGRRDHPADEMAASRMARQHQRPFDQLCRLTDCRGDFLDDPGDADLRAERVGRHGDGVTAGDSACGEMRPEALVELQPESTVHEDDQAFRRAIGEEKVHAISGSLAIGKVEFRQP
ncbi:hypothetical protein D9M70_497160 [compost metagenome]